MNLKNLYSTTIKNIKVFTRSKETAFHTFLVDIISGILRSSSVLFFHNPAAQRLKISSPGLNPRNAGETHGYWAPHNHPGLKGLNGFVSSCLSLFPSHLSSGPSGLKPGGWTRPWVSETQPMATLIKPLRGFTMNTNLRIFMNLKNNILITVGRMRTCWGISRLIWGNCDVRTLMNLVDLWWLKIIFTPIFPEK